MDHDAELDAIVAELEKAGLVETYVDDEDETAYRLTEQSARVARGLAATGDETALEALLEGQR